MITLLQGESHRACIIHYVSWKCRRVTRLILAAEVHAFTACLDWCVTFGHDLSKIVEKDIPISLLTDSKSLSDAITKLSTVSEKSLLTDLAAVQESYKNGEVFNIAHISSYNLADAFTKKMEPYALQGVMRSGFLEHPINQWIIQN